MLKASGWAGVTWVKNFAQTGGCDLYESGRRLSVDGSEAFGQYADMAITLIWPIRWPPLA